MRFRNRLSLFLILLLVVAQAVTGAFVYGYARQAMVSEGKQQLASANETFLRHLDMLADRVSTGVQVLALDYGLRSAIAENDRATALSTLRNHGRRIEARRMMFIDLDTVVRADTRDAGAGGTPFPFDSLIETAYREGSATALATLDGETSWIVVAPVLAPTAIGFVAAFVPVDGPLLDDMRRLASAPLSIALATSAAGEGQGGGWRVLATSADRAQHFELPAGFDPYSRDVMISAHEGRDYLVSARELPTAKESPPIFVIHEHRLDDVLSSNWEVFGPLLFILLAGVVVAASGAFIIARGIARPIEALAGAARRIRAGDYGIEREIASDDEIGQLATALADMADGIRAREERLIETARSLETARDQARDADRAKSQFIANMSHELRTPLNAIIGFGDVIREEQLGPVGKPDYIAFAGYICKSGRELLALHNDIIDTAKFDAGKFDLRRDIFDAVEIVEKALADLSGMAREGGVSLSVERNFDLSAKLDGDYAALARALRNVMHNAVKFTPRGGSVVIAARAENDMAVIDIRDTGVGMRQDDVGRLTKPFQRGSDEYNAKHAGAGLGLSLASAIMALHGGVLTIASAPGAGTIVTLRAPIVVSACVAGRAA